MRFRAVFAVFNRKRDFKSHFRDENPIAYRIVIQEKNHGAIDISQNRTSLVFTRASSGLFRRDVAARNRLSGPAHSRGTRAGNFLRGQR